MSLVALRPFLSLSYPVATPDVVDSFPNATYYGIGRLDACLVITLILTMAVLRDLVRVFVLEPAARWKLTRNLQSRKAARANGSHPPNGTHKQNGHANGYTVKPPSKKELRQMHRSVLRFAEQGYSYLYYICCWSYGFYVHRNLPTHILNPAHVWIGYPHFPLPGPVKFYYILQTAFYLHQIFILNAEARRKDHHQMMTHHVVTIALLVLSYFYNFTRVGCLVMIIMDFCDILLPLAKMFRYLSYTTLCDATFVLFLVSWFVTRHVFYNLVLWSVLTEMLVFLPPGWNPEEGYFLTRPVWKGFVALLVSLQLMQMIWFWMICRIAYRVVMGQGAEDTRSDESDLEEDKKDN